MENIAIKYRRTPYVGDKDILRLFRHIAGECDSKKNVHVIVAEQEYRPSQIKQQKSYKRGTRVWEENGQEKNLSLCVIFPALYG